MRPVTKIEYPQTAKADADLCESADGIPHEPDDQRHNAMDGHQHGGCLPSWRHSRVAGTKQERAVSRVAPGEVAADRLEEAIDHNDQVKDAPRIPEQEQQRQVPLQCEKAARSAPQPYRRIQSCSHFNPGLADGILKGAELPAAPRVVR